MTEIDTDSLEHEDEYNHASRCDRTLALTPPALKEHNHLCSACVECTIVAFTEVVNIIMTHPLVNIQQGFTPHTHGNQTRIKWLTEHFIAFSLETILDISWGFVD